MGRLHEFFEANRDNLEDAVSKVLAKADATIDSMGKKIEQLEQELRDVAGEKPKATDDSQVVTSDTTSKTRKKAK